MDAMSHPRQDHEDIAHDVLAAEEFALGSADPELHRRHEQAERGQAHDVLAAEEFAMPAPTSRPFGSALTSRRGGRARLAAEGAALLVLIVVLLRRRG